MIEVDNDVFAELEATLGGQDPSECAHMIRRSGGLGAGALITAAAESGMELTALCGWKWVPRGHAPDNMQPCQPCIDVWSELAGGS